MSLEDERPGSAADVEMRAEHAKRVAEYWWLHRHGTHPLDQKRQMTEARYLTRLRYQRNESVLRGGFSDERK